MAFIPTADGVRVSVEFTLFGQTVVITLWFKGEAPATDTTLASLGTLLDTWVTGDLLPAMSADIAYTGLTLVAQDSSSAPALYMPKSPAVSGGRAATSMPGNVTYTIKFSTAQRGRSGRGRNYMPGISSDAVSGNQIAASLADEFVAAYQELADMLETDGNWTHVVVSHQEDNVPRLAGLAQPVTSYSYADYDLDSQRRRLAGRGT